MFSFDFILGAISQKPYRFILDSFHITARSYPIASDRSVPLDFSRYFVTFLILPLLLLFSSSQPSFASQADATTDLWILLTIAEAADRGVGESGKRRRRRHADAREHRVSPSSDARYIHQEGIFLAVCIFSAQPLRGGRRRAKLANQIRSRPVDRTSGRGKAARIYSRPSVCRRRGKKLAMYPVKYDGINISREGRKTLSRRTIIERVIRSACDDVIRRALYYPPRSKRAAEKCASNIQRASCRWQKNAR